MTIKIPLSDLQKGMLFEIQQFKGRNYYINQELLCFNTALDVFLMRKTFELLVAKYEVLRSAIVFDSYHPSFIVYKNIKLPFEFYDYSNFEETKKNDLFSSFVKEDFLRSIDITSVPLMRVSIFKFTENDYRIIWDIHHIILDGASITRIIEDLFRIYSLLLKDNTYFSSEVIPYYKVGHYEGLLNRTKAEEYWKHLLNNHDISSFLPYSDKKNITLNEKHTKTLYINSIEYQNLTDFIRNSSLTFNTLLQAAWAVVLSHYSNNENIVFGSIRAYPKDIVQNYAGLFMNTLPMSFNINFNMTAIDFLHEVREQSKKLRDYITTPLSQIHLWGNLPLDSPIYQAIINYEPFSLNKNLAKHFPEIPCRFSSKLDAPYPLVLEIANDGDSLQLDLYYEAGLFSDEYMGIFLIHYKDVLFQIISNPNKKLVEFPVVNTSTFHKVVYAWNNTATDYPLDQTVGQLFEKQVEKNPDAPAVVFGEEVLSYRTLNEKSNQLAHYFLRQGIAKEDRVVIWLKPRLEVLISILAVLKSGGAYVPIDVNNPQERIKHILQDSQPKFILTEAPNLFILSDLTYKDDFILPSVIDIDQLVWQEYPKTNPLTSVQPSNLMYVIYTSGSTGKPKGSLIEHFSAINMALSCSQRMGVSSESRILQIASFSFDVSVAEWCMALLSGASLYLIDRDVFSPRKMVNVLKQSKISTIILAHSILAVFPETDLPDLTTIAPGGEPLSKHTLAYWAKNRLLLNTYGITETSVCSTMAECTPKTETVTIGKPLANVQIYILNKFSQPLPPGVVGEIYIGGYGVGRGYWNNPVLTKEKFVDNPFLIDKAEYSYVNNKLYKTGDFGRWTNDGEIEFIGRIDDQVKIRGFRIEISEIEHVLEQYQGIEKAIVLVKELGKNKQLLGYILLSNNDVVDMAKLQKYLSDHLPPYMIPAQIFQIDELPLTTHGKIDKKRLLAINNDDAFDKYVAHDFGQGGVTEKILDIIRNMVQKKDIPISKNFLEIGFDSIMLVELSMRLSAEFNKNIDVTTLFTYTTISKLADFIKKI